MQLSRLGFIRAFIESVGPSIRCGVSGALPSRYTVDDRARSDSGSGVRLPRPPARAWTPHPGRDFDLPRHSHYSGVIPMVFEHSDTAPHTAAGGPDGGSGAARAGGPRGAARAGAVRGNAWRWSGRGRRADRGLPRAESRPVRVRSESPIDRVKR